LRHLNTAYEVSGDPARVATAEKIILPGVGAFGDAMTGLRDKGLIEPIRARAADGVPILGICLGMQLLCDRSAEFGDHAGLGLIPGSVRRLPEGGDAPGAIRIPNVGWRKLHHATGDPLFASLGADPTVYFVHSFVPFADDEHDVAATIPINGISATAILRRSRILGYQFHPEKSGPVGLMLMRKFLEGNY
jgi:glutamine amidotransferase